VTNGGRVLAVDLGATSIRVAAVDLEADSPSVDLVHRWRQAPIRASDGTLRWDWPRIIAEVEAGLELARSKGPVASIGVDGWGVDYGLVGGDGDLVGLPFSYRDRRTEGWRTTAEVIGFERLYEITGIQIMGINTLFQLAVHDRLELERAERLLFLPDLLVHALTGFEKAERSNASTSAMVDISKAEWSEEILATIAAPTSIFPELVDAGQPAGMWRGIPVTTVGSHDTASAFLGMPGVPDSRTVFVSSGTWVLVGVERDAPNTSESARLANFSNERGAFGGVRFLKNIMGFWMLEQCRPEWGNPTMEELVAEAEIVTWPVPTVDATDDRFLSPASMVHEMVVAAGFLHEPSRAEIVRCILESIAMSVGTVIDELTEITGERMERISVVGGGARVTLLNQLIGRRTGLPITVGSSEATALGNAVAQGLGIGRFQNPTQARQWLETTGLTL
jgi:rhamnulokinase